jgi:hypothetical protein
VTIFLELKYSYLSYRSIARQRLGKDIPAEACARNTSSLPKQRISKEDADNREAVFSAWPVPRSYKGTKNVVFESFFLDLGRFLAMAAEGDQEEMARNELDCAKEHFMCDLKRL